MRDVSTQRRVVIHAVLIVGAVLMATPFVWEILTSLKTLPETTLVPPRVLPKSPQWSNYGDVFTTIPFVRQIVNTLLMTLGRVAGQLFFCSLAAFAFARLKFPMKNALFFLFMSVTMAPVQLFLIPQYRIMLELGWLNSLQALIVPGMFSALGTFLLMQFFKSIPRELDEAAALDGCNPFQTYWYVILPLAKPGLVALGIVTTVWSWNDFLWPLIVNTDPGKMTVSAGLSALQGQYVTNYPVLMAGAVMATIPVILVFAVLQRQFIEGLAASGIKG